LPENEFYWHEEEYERQALNDASSHLKKILDAKYEPGTLRKSSGFGQNTKIPLK